MIFVAMILLGSVIGFVGAGGAGVTITLLTESVSVFLSIRPWPSPWRP